MILLTFAPLGPPDPGLPLIPGGPLGPGNPGDPALPCSPCHINVMYSHNKSIHNTYGWIIIVHKYIAKTYLLDSNEYIVHKPNCET